MLSDFISMETQNIDFFTLNAAGKWLNFLLMNNYRATAVSC